MKIMKKMFLLLLISNMVFNHTKTVTSDLDFGALAVQIDELDHYPYSELPTIITECANSITSENFPDDEQRGYLKTALKNKFINLTTGENARFLPQSRELSNLVNAIDAPPNS
jgi:hypothetical protein